MVADTNRTEAARPESDRGATVAPIRMKKFVASTMKDAMAQIKKEMGDGAIILKSQKIPSNDVFSFRNREKVEVLAALEPPESVAEMAAMAASPPSRSADYHRKLDTQWEMEFVKEEIRSIRSTLEEISNKMKYDSMPSLPRQLMLFYQSLVGSGLDEKLVLDLVGKALATLSGDILEDRKAIADFLVEEIAPLIPSSPFIPPPSPEPRVIAFVGPTGVGKTTSLSKLLTNRKIYQGRRMAVISADTYRIGAIEQLKKVANIAHVPLAVVYKPSQVVRAIQAYHDKDVIFIDTAGRSQSNHQHLQSLKEFMAAAKPDEIHLVVAANTRLQDMIETADRFAKVPFHRYLFTKLDETSGYGNVVNLLRHNEKPLSFLSYGQKVPDEIKWAKSLEFARMLISGKRYGS
jgi:flagellar biosynthesis protein FlhF